MPLDDGLHGRYIDGGLQPEQPRNTSWHALCNGVHDRTLHGQGRRPVETGMWPVIAIVLPSITSVFPLP